QRNNESSQTFSHFASVFGGKPGEHYSSQPALDASLKRGHKGNRHNRHRFYRHMGLFFVTIPIESSQNLPIPRMCDDCDDSWLMSLSKSVYSVFLLVTIRDDSFGSGLSTSGFVRFSSSIGLVTIQWEVPNGRHLTY